MATGCHLEIIIIALGGGWLEVLGLRLAAVILQARK
jgi:hypothetical protein